MGDAAMSDGWAMVVGLVALFGTLAVAAFAIGRLEHWDAEKARSEALRKLMGVDRR